MLEFAPEDLALLRLLSLLEARGYDFVAPTPLTHARVVGRRGGEPARGLRDVLGWSLPFRRESLDAEIASQLEAADVLESHHGLLKSRIRVSRVRGLLFVHSAFPTVSEDSVFLGPDSYRFAGFIAQELAARSWLGRAADVGGGAGVGALTAAAGRGCSRLIVSDVNPAALRFARISAAHAGTSLETIEASGAAELPADLDLVLANPPYIGGVPDQTYQDGGAGLGIQVALDWAAAVLPKLAQGGRFLLYSGSAILEGGHDVLKGELVALAENAGARLSYREIDPDVFGEELERPAYRSAERIAAVGAVLSRSR